MADFELAKIHRYYTPDDTVEILTKMHAKQEPILWKMKLPSAFSLFKDIWHEEGWLASGRAATRHFANMIHGLLDQFRKGKKK